MAGNDAMLTGLSWGPATSAPVRAISAVLAAGSRLGAGGSGGAAGGGGTGGGGKAMPGRFGFESPASTWREFVAGQLNNPAVGPQNRLPGFVGSDGGLFASLPPGLLDPGRPWNRVPDRIRDRLETLLAGLQRPDRPSRPGMGEPPLPLPGNPGGPGTNLDPPGEIIPNPEPSSLALMGIGLASVAGVTWRRRRRQAVAE
ncbi:MAG: PEP-CTERM sorting domain-containing protein [Maioricimonas sp. JB049]